jgi:hypothetical protein
MICSAFQKWPGASWSLVRGLLVFLAYLTVAPSSPERPKIRSLHGTVNVFLGNSNGLVAVTDSRLSSAGQARGYGHKLFRVDERTICSVAGTWAIPGYQFSKINFIGAAIISKTMAAFAERIRTAAWFSSLSVNQKLDLVASSVAFRFNVALDLEHIASIRPAALQEIYLTMAGYDRGGLEIVQQALVPTLSKDVIQFIPGQPATSVVKNSLVSKVAGIRDLSESILNNPEKYRSRAGAIARYALAKKQNRTDTLKIPDLIALGLALEKASADSDSSEIGGPPEIAILQNGTISKFDNRFSADEQAKDMAEIQKILVPFHRSGDIEIRGSGHQTFCAVVAGDIGEIFVNGTFSNCTQPLDKIVFANTKFTNVRFTYDGSFFLFGNTNAFDHCVLELGPHADREDPALRALRKAYPSLFVEERENR